MQRLLVFLFYFCFVQVEASNEYQNGVLTLVDSNQTNYLFRGKIPIHQDRFMYDELSLQFRNYLKKKGKELKDNYKLVCISLLNLYEARKCRIELSWFHAHPEKGCLHCHPIYGSFINPLICPNLLRQWDLDDLQKLVHALHQLLHKQQDENLVIYLHCNAGKDRTGEVSACYLMQYKGYAYKDVIALNQEIAKRGLRYCSLNAIRWYALYLKERKHYTTIGSID